MDQVQRNLPREAVHIDAVHDTYLMFGIRVNAGQQKEAEGWVIVPTENGDRYHISTICDRIARNFYANIEEEEHIPTSPKRELIHSIETDMDFIAHAKIEFDHLQIQEEEPPLVQSPHEEVNELRNRLVEAFQLSAAENKDSVGCLELARMREIRDDVFQKVAARREERARPPMGENGEEEELEHEPNLEERETCCGPKAFALAGVAAVVLLILGVFNGMNEPQKEQKVSRVNKQGLGINVRHGSSAIY